MLSRPPLLLSLKPRYADLVFDELKKIEFRRRIATNMKGRDVFIYVSSPARHLRGGFRVADVHSGAPEEIWEKVSELGSVDKRDFDTYFEGRSVAYALEISDVWEYENPIKLDELRSRFQNFVVPQSWRYVRNEEYMLFRELKPGADETSGGADIQHEIVAIAA